LTQRDDLFLLLFAQDIDHVTEVTPAGINGPKGGSIGRFWVTAEAELFRTVGETTV
jgi:hypothetical protein